MNSNKESKKDESEKQNLANDLERFNKEIEKINIEKEEEYLKLLDECIKSYFKILSNLSDWNSSKFNVYFSSYLTAIINNFLVIKGLFRSGYELQLQVLMRAQYEQLNIILSILLNESFFNQFSKIGENEEKFIPLTPKQKHCTKILNKYFKQRLNNQEYTNLSNAKNILYDKFSKSTHGNLTQVMLLSRFNEGNMTNISLAGSSNMILRTKNLVESFYTFSMIINHSLNKELKRKSLIDVPAN